MLTVARRLLLVLGLLTGLAVVGRAQTVTTDSLRRALARTAPDSTRVLLLVKLAHSYRASRPDSTMRLAQKAWRLARQLGFEKGEGRAQGLVGATLRERGELPRAFVNQLAAYELSRRTGDLEGQATSLNALGNIRLDLRQYRPALRYYQQSGMLYARLHMLPWLAGSLTNQGSCYEQLNMLDSALALQSRAAALQARQPRPRLASAALALRNMGNLQARLGHYPAAFACYREVLRETGRTNDLRNRAVAQYRMAELFWRLHQPDSSLHYARLALHAARQVSYRLTILEASNLLTKIYQAQPNADSALHYQSLAVTTKDSLFGPEKFLQLQRLAFADQLQRQELREARALQTARYQRLGLLAALGCIGLVALVLGWANRQQRRTNRLLNERNAQIEAQRNALDQALTELRATQNQLVAAEKWAFVGELSAGIAHELQNPLAFMRKFADVSVNLLGPNGQDHPTGLGQEIMAGLRQNLQEISQHGQRASFIIADMLAHARTGSSPHVPTDLNALVAENLRLAGNDTSGPRAAVPVRVDTDFAPDLAPVLAAPPELGRALLNLFTNALYAARQRRGGPGQPQVRVSTRRVGQEVEIRVRDNGVGMTAAVAAQVFQPFFTTKPKGEGTGLGLSLAHDIITKSHHGTLTLETQPEEFTEFTVRLPI